MSWNMPTYNRGDHVKVEFADEYSGESEWMWVKVSYSDDEKRLVFGKLDSQPIVVTDLKVGQELAIGYDNVHDHRRFTCRSEGLGPNRRSSLPGIFTSWAISHGEGARETRKGPSPFSLSRVSEDNRGSSSSRFCKGKRKGHSLQQSWGKSDHQPDSCRLETAMRDEWIRARREHTEKRHL
jgi:hypothetical protein